MEIVYVYTKMHEGSDTYAELDSLRVFTDKESATDFLRKDYESTLRRAKEDGNTYDTRQCEDIGEPYVDGTFAFLPTGDATNQSRTTWALNKCPVQGETDAERELAKYKEAEARRLLLKLPCPFGTRVYVIYTKYKSAELCSGVSCNKDWRCPETCEYWDAKSADCKCPLPANGKYGQTCGIYATTFRPEHLFKFGHYVFKTTSEAEAALELLKQGPTVLDSWFYGQVDGHAHV